MSTSDIPRLCCLLDLLQAQTPTRLQSIAQQWACDSDPRAIYQTMMKSDGWGQTLSLLTRKASHRNLLVDFVQDYNAPLTLYPEDRSARQAFAHWGMIYPYPQDWPGAPVGRVAQRTWVMPLEVAMLAVPTVPVYRVSLPLLLHLRSDGALDDIAQTLDLPRHDNEHRILWIERLCKKLLDPGFVMELLEDPDWFDHFFLLQTVLEWHGSCYPGELFSFVWNQGSLVPMAGHAQQRRERDLDQTLRNLGLLHRFRPLEDENTIQTGLDEVEDLSSGVLMVLPEEIRPMIWATTRGMQERALGAWLEHHGGWSQDNRGRPKQHLEPLDQLKALACLIDDTALSLDDKGALSQGALDHLTKMSDQTASPWPALVSLAQVCGVLAHDQRTNHLTPQSSTMRLLDEDAHTWASCALRHWVSGTGPETLDQAQNLALGISQSWLTHVSAASKRMRHQSTNLEDWWCKLDSRAPGPEAAPNVARVTRRRVRPLPSWLAAPGLEADSDVWCGCPRQPDERPRLPEELLLIEGIVTLFRLLILDLLSGLPTGMRIAMGDFASFLQDAASMAVQLHLAVFHFDSTRSLSIPVRPPSFLADQGATESFMQLGHSIVSDLFLPAGIAHLTPEGFSLCSDRIEVATPNWVPHRGRLDALAGIVEMDPADLDLQRTPHVWLRSLDKAQQEDEHRIWLGRPMRELKHALKGRSIVALRGAYLELAASSTT